MLKHARPRRAPGAIAHRRFPRPWPAFAALLVLLGVFAACGGGNDGESAQSPPAGTAAAAVAAGGHGLLIPRDQRLFLRDMSTDKEYVLKRAEANVFYTYPRWSPDGTRIAYALDVTYSGLPSQNWGSDIAVINADRPEQEQIVFRRPAPGVRVEGLAWSPDGAALYVSLLETTIKDGRFLGQTLNLERLDLATGERQVIIPDAANPTVSPDGGTVAYVTYASGDDPGGLWVARADGSDRRRVVAASGQFVSLAHPRFSPDGATIAFSAATVTTGTAPSDPAGRRSAGGAHARPIDAHGLPQDIWLVPAAGGQPARLTNMLEDEPTVAWSPDGRQIAIAATGGLYLIDAGGGEPRKIGLGGTLIQIDWR